MTALSGIAARPAWSRKHLLGLEELSAAENEMKQAAAIYGDRHPQYQLGQIKLRRVEADLNAFGEESKGGTKVVAGDSFMTGEVVVGPSSAQVGVALGVAFVVGLASGIWMARHSLLTTAYSGFCMRIGAQKGAWGNTAARFGA